MRGYGEKGTLLHCWWERKLVQPLWKTVWRFLRKLKIELPYDPAIPLLGIYLDKTIIQKDHSKKIVQGFPGGAVVESPPAGAGDTGSSPGLGGSHMPRSNWACEPQLLSLRSATREAAMVRGPRTAMKSGPRSPQLGRALARKRRPNTAKDKLIN